MFREFKPSAMKEGRPFLDDGPVSLGNSNPYDLREGIGEGWGGGGGNRWEGSGCKEGGT